MVNLIGWRHIVLNKTITLLKFYTALKKKNQPKALNRKNTIFDILQEITFG